MDFGKQIRHLIETLLKVTKCANNAMWCVCVCVCVCVEEYCYQLGLAYFYSYEEGGNKNNSKKWLQIASKATMLESYKIERSQILLKIAEYYTKIGVQSKSGDESTSYLDYWQDLTSLCQGNIVEKDNVVTALMIYNEVVFQIATNASKFQNASVSNEEMVEQIKNIINHVEEDIDDVDMEKQRVQLLVKKIVQNVKVAERELETNFSIPDSEED